MEQNATDNTLLLGLLSHFHQTAIRIIVVFTGHILQPVGTGGDIIGTRICVKKFYLTTTHGHIDDTYALVFRQTVTERTSEIVGRCQSRRHAYQWRNRLIPFPFLTGREFQGVGTLIPGIGLHRRRIEIHGSHRQETGGNTDEILRLRTCITLHIRLPEAEENMEILVLCGCVQYSQGGNH